MSIEYSAEICKKLEARFRATELYRPMRISRYDPGTELTYRVSGVGQTTTAQVHLVVDKFAGGGFAGQVYRVKVLGIENDDGPTPQCGDGSRAAFAGLEVGRVYAMKILTPPSSLSRLFRNMLYWIGFQGPFQPQVNPAAAKAGALWQKFIRRGAKIRFGDESTVADIYAIFVDDKLGSCGELSEWIDGRTWQLEVDDRLDLLKLWRRGKITDETAALLSCPPPPRSCLRLPLRLPTQGGAAGQEDAGGTAGAGESKKGGGLGSPEYRTKRKFMSELVELLYDMGAYELARQYEWSTCKSQPNCLKRRRTDGNPSAGPAMSATTKPAFQAPVSSAPTSGGLVAVDFRAGLALLPLLPMSPGDFKLIVKGLIRGSLVQFDRGDVTKLEAFVQAHGDKFADSAEMLEELKNNEQVYRNSVLDITHNHIRLLYSQKLWSTMRDSAVTGWQVLNFLDEQHERKLRSSRVLTLLFFVIGMIPFLGKFLRRIWGRADWRRHYGAMLTSWDYFRRAVQGRIAEKVIVWHRAGRASGERALRMAEEPWRFWYHLPLSILPARLHRFLTHWQFAKDKLAYIFVRPIRLYFNAELREKWLREMMTEGQKKNMLSDEDAKVILSQINEPFIQKYLISLVVHLCTLPASEITWVTCAFIYWLTHRGQPHTFAVVAGIVAAFQVVPISPGSLIRGFYVLYLIIRQRNFKDYNIAVFLGFLKYVGYLAFPIQMTYHYPALARFMATHWATEAVHIVPVFGEQGALLEHWVFCLFYNWPLTIRSRMRKRAEVRTSRSERYWHAGLCAAGAAGIFGLVDFAYLRNFGELPGLREIWWLAIFVPLVCGAVVTLGCGGAPLWKRIIAAAVCGAVAGMLHTAASVILSHNSGIAASCVWRIFIFAVLSTIGAVVTELKLPYPDLA